MSVTSWIRRQFKDGVSVADTLSAPLSSGTTTTFTMTDGTTFPDGTVGPFIVTIDQGMSSEEKVLIQSRTGAVFSIASNGRGYNGTTAFDHASGASVKHTIDAQDLDEANQAAFQTLGAIAAKGDLLAGTAVNTLGKLSAGTNAQFLTAQSGQTTGLQWHTLAQGDITGFLLAAIETLFTANKQVIMGTGNGTGALTDLLAAMELEFTQAGQVLMGTGNGTGALTLLPRTNSTASSATPSINVDSTDLYEVTALAVAITGVTITGTPHDGQKLIVRIKDNGTTRAVTWGASFASSGVATLMTNTPAGKQTTSGFMYDANTSKWVLLAVDSAGY